MECKILSGRGKVLIKNGETETIIPPYPKIIHPPQIFEKPMVAELKWNGYNVRTFLLGDEIISILRGGRPDMRTRDMILKHYGDNIQNFLKDHPNMILCGEVIGKKTMAKYKGVDFDYLIFDIIEKTNGSYRFLGYDEKRELIEKYKFNYVGSAGVFQNLNSVLDKMKTLPGPDDGIEGVVLKTLDGKYIFKLRYDMHPELFGEKIVNEWRGRERKEEVIFAHFIQGYPEEELGLKKGISIEDFQKLESEMESFFNVNENELENKYREICDYLYSLLINSGDFDSETKDKLYNIVKRFVSKELKKAKKHRGR